MLKNLKDGDMIMTPKGMKKLTKDYNHDLDFYVFTTDGKYTSFFIQYQITKENHPEYFL
jgi:hypothetical protein